jgi:prepilin-type N-terminal cleavage/methylation domain-containing protein
MRVLREQARLRQGFTLLELVGTISIIVILTGILAIGFGDLLPASKGKRASADMVRIQQALEDYKLRFGEYPKQMTVTGLSTMEDILFNALAGRLAPNGSFGNFKILIDRNAMEFTNGNFPIVGETPAALLNAIVDPWGNPFRYRFDPDSVDWKNFNYVLFSVGPDGEFAEVTLEGQKNESDSKNLDNIYTQ